MKKNKSIKKLIAVLLCIVLLACSFAGCSSSETGDDVSSSNSSAQGDNNGGSNGKDGDAGDNNADKKDKSEKSGEKSENKSDKNENTKNNSKETIKKPSKPADVTSLKASKITSSSVTLTWKKVNCAGYRIRVFDSKGNKIKDVTCKSNTYNVTKLESYTSYEFRVRAYNENEAGKSESKDASVTASTKAVNSQRKIKITVRLPENSAVEDTLNVYIVDGKKEVKIKTAKVKCDGGLYTFTTDKKYRGVVTIKAELINNKAVDTVKTDKNSVTLNLTKIGIIQIDGEDD